MANSSEHSIKPVWIQGPNLRKRWDDMPVSTFYRRLRKGAIPAPEYPFGRTVPYWRLETIERFEEASKATA